MKQWLLRQKQTQNWGNVPSTVDAIYALLLTGKDQLNQSEKITVELGKQTLPVSTTANPLGYLKYTYTASEIQPDMLNADITQTTDSLAGAVYICNTSKNSIRYNNRKEYSVSLKTLY